MKTFSTFITEDTKINPEHVKYIQDRINHHHSEVAFHSKMLQNRHDDLQGSNKAKNHSDMKDDISAMQHHMEGISHHHKQAEMLQNELEKHTTK